MGVMRSFVRELLHTLAEVEVRFSSPGSLLYFRKMFFRLAKVKFESDIWVGPSFRLSKKGNLALGHRCAIGANSTIQNPGLICIGDDFLASSQLTLASGSHDPVTLEPQVSGIEIGHRVWCGVNVTIIDGVKIGDDVVIGAGSVVCKDIPSNSIAVGVPARRVKHLSRTKDTKLWHWG